MTVSNCARALAWSRHGICAVGVLMGVALLLVALLHPAHAQRAATASKSITPPPNTKAERAVLMDAQSGAIIYQHNADVPAPPDGLSKLMTLAVVFRALKAGGISLQDEVKMSESSWRRGGAPSGWTAMFVPVNTKEPLDVLLQGIIVQSANDATMAIAEHVAGSQENFVRLMNAEASRLGLEQARFTNATGLPDADQQITVRELAQLARYLMREYPEFYPRFGQKVLEYRKYKFVNDNPLLGARGVDGLKTGFIKKAGNGLVASGNHEGRRLILVVAGIPHSRDVKPEAEKLLDWGFDALEDVKLFEAGEVVASARVWGGDRMWLPLKGDGAITIVLPRYPPNQKLRAEVVYKRPLKTPIKKGAQVATLRVTSSSSAVSEVPLYAAEDVGPGGIVRRGFDTIVHHTLGWLL